MVKEDKRWIHLQVLSIYNLTEEKALRILNSKKFKLKWKKDFRKDWNANEDWDLINSDGIKIEVKSTINEYRYNGNYLTLNTPNQHKAVIFKMLLNKSGRIRKWAVIKKDKNKWINIYP